MPSDTEVKSELDLGEPSKELLDYALTELNEDPKTRCQVLQDFRDMIFERGECVPHRTDDAFLLRFLRARGFVVEKAHRLFVNYYEFKLNNPEFFDNVRLSHMQRIGEMGLLIVPPYREQTGRRCLLYRMGIWDPSVVTIEEIFQATLIIMELAILEQRAQILGGICIFDLGGLSMQQAWYMTPSIAHKIVQIMVTSFPLKIHALHIVNQSWVFDIVFSIFKPLMTEAMTERVFFHGTNMESLHQHIEPKHLPERYGGIHPDYNYNDWFEFFKGSEIIVKELKSLGYKEEHEIDAGEENDESTEDSD